MRTNGAHRERCVQRGTASTALRELALSESLPDVSATASTIRVRSLPTRASIFASGVFEEPPHNAPPRLFHRLPGIRDAESGRRGGTEFRQRSFPTHVRTFFNARAAAGKSKSAARSVRHTVVSQHCRARAHPCSPAKNIHPTRARMEHRRKSTAFSRSYILIISHVRWPSPLAAALSWVASAYRLNKCSILNILHLQFCNCRCQNNEK